MENKTHAKLYIKNNPTICHYGKISVYLHHTPLLQGETYRWKCHAFVPSWKSGKFQFGRGCSFDAHCLVFLCGNSPQGIYKCGVVVCNVQRFYQSLHEIASTRLHTFRLLTLPTLTGAYGRRKTIFNYERSELKKRVADEYDRRQQKSDVRYRALDKIGDYLKASRKDVVTNVSALMNIDRDDLKEAYRNRKPSRKLSDAESSAFNEIYNQLRML